jgi:hypothetical protein
MSLHRLAPALASLLALCASLAEAAGPDQIYVGITTIQPFDRTQAPETRWEHLVIYPQGLALREIPSGGLDYDNIEKLAEKHDSKVGSYTRTDEGLEITWGRNARKPQVWKLEPSGTGWARGPDTMFKPADRLDKAAIKGIWQKQSSTPSSTVNLSGGEFIFRTNGEFEQGSKHGRYELDGYTITLHDSTGATRRYTIYRWPWAAGTIAIDTGLFQLLQSRQ